jgi:molybdopterin/thiamine biosynthesis adenylyltransferase
MEKNCQQGQDRISRFASLYKDTIDSFINQPHIIIGCGAIGGPVIKTLGQIGVKEITIWDDDTVEEVNLGPQGFPENSIGMEKTEIRAEEFSRLSTKSICHINSSLFKKHHPHNEDAYWWLCVDDLDSREFIYKVAMEYAPHKIIDFRMGGLAYEIYNPSVNEDSSDPANAYLETIEWARENTVQESCTTKSTPHTAMIAVAIGINMGLTRLPPFAIKGNLMDYSQMVAW